jgi:hypothetical protein
MDDILTILAIVAPFAGATGLAINKAVFLVKAIRQAVEAFEEAKEENEKIYNRIQLDPSKRELARVLDGSVKRVKGLTRTGRDR